MLPMGRKLQEKASNLPHAHWLTSAKVRDKHEPHYERACRTVQDNTK